ncbi:MAG: quinone oxidoreductase [Myxococcaceae bacterium]
MRALCLDRFGGPEVLELRELPDPEPPAGHARVRVKSVGLNFADVYRRRGDYHIDGAPPYVLGYEGAGVVDASADPRVKPGDRVGFADVPRANADCVIAPVDKLIPLPAETSFDTAAASLLQGLTAQYLVRDSHPLKPGETMLVHAAAGGVGLMLCQLGKLLGAHVWGVTSTEAKAAEAHAAGAERVFTNDWRSQARDVDVVYDSVGSTLDDSLKAARRGGHVVFYGMAGGNPAPVDPRRLMDESKTLTGGDLWNVLTSREQRLARASELFGWLSSGALTVRIAERVPLAEGARAHQMLEGRGVVGKVLLIP